jgi:hypothetical protein
VATRLKFNIYDIIYKIMPTEEKWLEKDNSFSYVYAHFQIPLCGIKNVFQVLSYQLPKSLINNVTWLDFHSTEFLPLLNLLIHDHSTLQLVLNTHVSKILKYNLKIFQIIFYSYWNT